MRKLTKPTRITDRSLVLVSAGVASLEHAGGGGVFVLAKNAIMHQGANTMTGAFSAYTSQPFKISGEFATIHLPGVLFKGTKFVEVPFAEPGDLSYIDGCSNSNLVSPPRNGDPCTNYLYFPANTKQTLHSHPSCRIGMVLSGSGTADLVDEQVPLVPGDVFVLDRFVKHGFNTSSEHMSLMVFHPDSDDGPTDERNPMKSRTYL